MEKLLIRNCEFMNIPIDSFFSKWTDVSFWNAWDINLRSAWLHDAFDKGSQGKVMFEAHNRCPFEINWVSPNYGYAFQIKLFLATLHFRRLVEVTETGICVIHELRYSGVPMFNNRLLKKIVRNNHQSLIRLKCLLEEEHFRNKISYIGNTITAKAS